ncbi:MAG TPA: phosphate ABC transporter substrate-binding protein PstS [Terriglobales bacterium]|nr:phosphate ABC transporter substrate-binding protein PstS [Terriglobales bacterium]
MKLQSRLFWVVFAAFAVFAAGCTSKSGQGGGNETVSLVGAGSTFINPIMSRWAANFQQVHPNVQINYQSIGSGAGIQQVKAGTVDFGASDVALDDAKLKDMPPVIQVPESAGPVCITYNLPDLKEPLKLTAATLSGIYLGTIKNWHDQAIVKANPGVKLPGTAIAVVHRSDGSGTTGIFTTYLAAVNPDWAKKVGASISVNWPVGLGGKGSEGVTGVVKQTPGAIGYVELSYATQNHLPVVEMENKAEKFVAPSAAGTTAAIDAFKAELSRDVRTPIVDPPASAPDAYPISGFTFLIIPKDGSDRAKRQELKDFVQYILTDGQQLSQGLDYAPLPSSISSLDQTLLSQMTAASAPLK